MLKRIILHLLKNGVGKPHFFLAAANTLKNSIQSVGQKIFHFLLDKFTLYGIIYITKELILMVEKNKRKEEAKKQRNMWTINPRTRRKGNDKAYNRKKFKKVEY